VNLSPFADRLVALDELTPGGRVIVGCSGGADSLALLALAVARGFDVVAVYVDHGLRGSVEHEINVVASAAKQLGACHRVERVAVAVGGNLEARARDARYDVLLRVAQEERAVAVLLGHTRDDQAETVLLNLIRGSGTRGLAGMPAVRGLLRRPLLALRRAETCEICARLGFAPVHDPMNDDERHRRVWLRREVIPRLERGASRDLVEVIARQAELMRDDDELLDALAAEQAPDDAAGLAAMPPALARRVLRRWLGSPPPSAATVERVLGVARGEARAVELRDGGRVERVRGRLARVDTAAREALEPVSLALPGRARFGGYDLEAWVEHGAPTGWPDGRLVAVCDADAIGDAAMVRVAAPAERFRPLGSGGSKLVRDALAEAGIPAGRRDRAPIVVAGGPVWVVGYRIDHRVRVTSRTRRYLWMSAEPMLQ
jgi:tRNA(Ile)-lysidine synthase